MGSSTLFDIKDPAAVMFELAECRKAKPIWLHQAATRLTLHVGTESCVIGIHRYNVQLTEPGFYLSRQEVKGRMLAYTINSYSTQGKPAGERY